MTSTGSLDVAFIGFIRDELKFDSIEALICRMPNVIHPHYKALVKEADAKGFWEITPDNVGQMIPLPKPAAAGMPRRIYFPPAPGAHYNSVNKCKPATPSNDRKDRPKVRDSSTLTSGCPPRIMSSLRAYEWELNKGRRGDTSAGSYPISPRKR